MFRCLFSFINIIWASVNCHPEFYKVLLTGLLASNVHSMPLTQLLDLSQQDLHKPAWSHAMLILGMLQNAAPLLLS